MLERDVIDRIRGIFLHQRPHVSIDDATALLGWTSTQMIEAVAGGEIEVTETGFGRWIWRDELMAKALEIWSPEAIEEALGPAADHALPSSIRLADLRVRLPRHHVAMLEHLAERDRTTLSHVLARELDGIASNHSEERSRTVAGFAGALAWPDADAAPQPC